MRRSAGSRPVLFWLRLLVIIAVVPAWAATALTIGASYERQLSALQKSAVAAARAVMDTVDRDLGSVAAALQTLAASPHFASGDSAALRAQLREVLSAHSAIAVALFDAAGQEIVSSIADGETTPRSRDPDVVRKILETARPTVSSLYVDGGVGNSRIVIGVPVMRDHKVSYIVTMIISSQRVSNVLRDHDLPLEWVVSVFDQEGKIVAGTRTSDRLVGQNGTPAGVDRPTADKRGAIEARTLEGIPVLANFSRSELSGWTAAVSIPTAELGASLRRGLWLSLAAASAIFSLGLILAWRIGLRIARSIRALSAPTLALASDAPVVIPSVEIREVDELGRILAKAGRLLEERTLALDRAEKRVRGHQAKLAHVLRVSLAGEMAAGMAHELSQPLTAIIAYSRGCLRLLANNAADPKLLKAGVREIVRQAERASDVLVRLRDFVDQGASRRQFVAVSELIDAAVALATHEAAPAQVEIAVTADPDLPLAFVDNIQIEQVILNLFRNAIDSMAAAGVEHKRIVVEARRQGAADVRISITDNGPGIAAEMQERIFEPFVTTKARGMGIGLAISQAFVEAHGGHLRLVPSRGAGASFVFDLPTTPAEMNNDAG